VPHFEKMLYDNAELAVVYVAAAQAAGRADFADVARGVLDDLLATFRAPEGAFYAARDADDPGGEGAYYRWTTVELEAALDPEQAALARAYYGIADGAGILRVARPLSAVAEALAVPPEQAPALLAEVRLELRHRRDGRPAPRIDAKILTSWNGLAISALARAGAALAEPRYVDAAAQAARFVLGHATRDGRLQHVYSDGIASQPAFLEDVAFLAGGLLDLFDATSDLEWLRDARQLDDVLAREFWDGEGGCYFDAGSDRDPRLPRTRPVTDDAVPSGNAVALENVLRLATLLDDDGARARAGTCLTRLEPRLRAAPTSAARMLGVLDAYLDRPRQIAIIEPAGGDPAGRAGLLAAVRARFLPVRALLVTREGAPLATAARALPFAAGKTALQGRAAAYVCEHGRCLAPTADPATLAGQLAAVRGLPAPDEAGD